MSTQTSFLLLGHGSRDPRLQHEMQQLADRLRVYLSSFCSVDQYSSQLGHVNSSQCRYAHPAAPTEPLIGTSVLEFGQKPLHLQIVDFAEQAAALGISKIEILPLFLLPGIHVLEDIPSELALARQQLGDSCRLVLHPPLGNYPPLTQLLVSRSADYPQATRILMAHGSRRPEAQQLTRAIANALNAEIAYWSKLPKLDTQIDHLIQNGEDSIAILLYILFSGGIRDAVTATVSAYAKKFPSKQLLLINPFNIDQPLISLVAHWAIEGQRVSLPISHYRAG